VLFPAWHGNVLRSRREQVQNGKASCLICMDIRLLDGAKEDLRNGWFFVEQRSQGLGDRFLDAIEAGIVP
jgi:hypothetical protein